MTVTKSDELFKVLTDEFTIRFSDMKLGFIAHDYIDRAELDVYVMEPANLPRVQEFCKRLERRYSTPSVEISIKPAIWSGSWPGGESVEKIRARREKFLKTHSVA